MRAKSTISENEENTDLAISLGFDLDGSATLSRQQYLDKIQEDGTKDSFASAKAHLRMLDYFAKDVHKRNSIEEIIDYIKTKSPDDAVRRRNVAIMLDQYVKWLGRDHPNIKIKMGRPKLKNPKRSRKYYTYQKKNQTYLRKNSSDVSKNLFQAAKRFISLTGGIMLTKDDVKAFIKFPKQSDERLSDLERGEPLTTEQAREVISLQKDFRSRTLYELMNDTAFRIQECWNLQEKDIDFTKSPVEVKLVASKSKGGYGAGVRYAGLHVARMLKQLCKDNPERHFLRPYESQGHDLFRNNELKKLRKIYDKLGMIEKYPDSDYFKFNMHSWRKRSTREYGKANGTELAHAYARHSRYLGMYDTLSKDDRDKLFLKAQLYMAIDEIDMEEIVIFLLSSQCLVS